MNKTKIEWADYTWNPVSGCLNSCPYCYARRIANRFKPHDMELMNIADCRPTIPISAKNLGCYECDAPVMLTNFKQEKLRVASYPQGFKPTFHRYRLDEPARKTKPSKIFVVSMGDLFGDWVPGGWQLEVYKACGKADWHKYLFLTKNPEAYAKVFYRSELDYRHNFWLGTTVTDDKSFYEKGYDLFESTGGNQKRHAHRFLSIEPLLEEISDTTLRNIQFMDWIIIGQQTNPNKPPKDEWVQSIIDQCKDAGVPVFVKSPLYEKFPIQEWPEGLK